MLLSVLEAWDGYHAAAPEARDCVGNTWDKPWDPIPSAFNYGIGIAGAVFAIHVAANSPFALGILPHSALIALQFAVSYAICVAYINVVVTTRPHPFKGRQGNYSDTLLICIASPWVIWMSFGWSDDVRECMRLDSERWYLGFLAPAGLLVGLHVVYLSRKFQTVASSWSIRQLRTEGPKAIISALWKFVLIFYAFCLHWRWCYLQPDGMTQLAAELGYNVIVWGSVYFITRWLGSAWYLHLHHYQLALLFLHASRFESVGLSLFMCQFCAAQFIEGAARWSAAPMWHKYRTA